MPHEKITLSEHDLKLLDKVSDLIMVQEMGII